MPKKYIRKGMEVRGLWTEEALKAAINDVKNNNISIYKAAILHGIPRKTLERRLKNNNDKKGPMGPSSVFGPENETKLASHIKSLQIDGFPMTMNDVRILAYHFANQLKLKHRFDKTKEKAGYDWLYLFLSRNKEITLRKSEGVSHARSEGMNKNEVAAYFELIEIIFNENELFDKPNCVFNMDETGLQLNNRPGHVLAQKGSKAVPMATSTEKGETITLIACPGSIVVMSEKSAYITTKIFFEWLKHHFVQRKPSGKVFLLMDGHSSHCNSVETLEYAVQNDVILVSMPSHTSHYLQPLDRSFFKSLKLYYYEACRLWVKQHPGRRITRLQFGTLLNQAWGKAATPENSISDFRATGIVPFNPGVIPEYAFQPIQEELPNRHLPNPEVTCLEYDAVPSTSKDFTYTPNHVDITPSKVLCTISPVPQRILQVRKRAKHIGTLLTSDDRINKRKSKQVENKDKEMKKQINIEKKTKNVKDIVSKSKKRKAIKKINSSNDKENLVMIGPEEEDVSDNCRGCGVNYYKTELIEDWLQCQVCKFWVHENCTEYDDMCSSCGQTKKQEAKEASKKGKGVGKRSLR